LINRANAFHRLFADETLFEPLTGALIAIGNYSLKNKNGRFFQFGSSSSLKMHELRWRELFAGAGRVRTKATRDVLGQLLDEIASTQGNLRDILNDIQTRNIQLCERDKKFNWRYYFVKYPCMREGESGIYCARNGTMGFNICMLRRSQMNSWYRDPYLLAIFKESGVGDAVEDPWFMGHEDKERALRVNKSGLKLICREEEIVLQASADVSQYPSFLNVCKQYGIDSNAPVLKIPGMIVNGKRVDTQDRVLLGKELLCDLINAGL